MKRQERIDMLWKTVSEMFPNAETELYHTNEFQLLIAILMSAQATDRQVNIINRNFFEHLRSPEDWIKMWVQEITDFINSVSFFNNKAKNILKTCEILVEKHNSIPPLTIPELTALPGVWIKTAKVFLSVTQNAPFLWVDTHVHRVLNRIWIVKTKSPLETDKKAAKIFKEEDLVYMHNALVLFWRYHCTARSPKCWSCPMISWCSFKDKNLENKKT